MKNAPVWWPARTFLLLAILVVTLPSLAQGSACFQITGSVTRPDDGCNQTLVVLCDGRSGEPLCRQTMQPFTAVMDTTNDHFAMDWLQAIPDAAGHFEFTNVPAGEYLVVAQAWNSPLPRTNLIHHSREFQIAARDFRVETLHLLGRAEITVPSAATGQVKLTSPGTNELRIAYQHDGEFLMLGTQPQRGDPVLLWLGWGTNFIRHLLGFGDIPRGGLMVHGLPAAAYASIFANDDSPGCGTTRLAFGDTNAVRIPVVAGWSDGYQTPPTNLVWLVEWVQTNRFRMDELLGISSRPKTRGSYFERQREEARLVLPLWEKEIVLPTGQKIRGADLLTALGYARLSGKYKN